MNCQHTWEIPVDHAMTGDGYMEYAYEWKTCTEEAVVEVVVGDGLQHSDPQAIQVCATHAIEEYGETEESILA